MRVICTAIAQLEQRYLADSTRLGSPRAHTEKRRSANRAGEKKGSAIERWKKGIAMKYIWMQGLR